MYRQPVNALAVCSMLVLLAAGSGVPAQSAFADHKEAEIEMPTSRTTCNQTGDCFIPADVTVDVGGKVMWRNTDRSVHSIASGSPGSEPTGLFGTVLSLAPEDIGFVLPGDSYSFRFDGLEPGPYTYWCTVHPWMSGTVTVVGAGGSGDAIIEEPEAAYALSDGTAITIKSGVPTEGERLEIAILFADSEHVNYDVVITQDGEAVLDDAGAYSRTGEGTHVTEPLPSSDAVDIRVTFQGYGAEEPFTGDNIGEEAIFTDIVPEFGAVAVIVLGAAVAGIVAATARSRIALGNGLAR